MKEYYIEDDGIRLHVKLEMPSGDRDCPLVIIVHGYSGNMDRPHIAKIAEAVNEAGAASLRVELYGHGKSGGNFRDHTLYKWISNMFAVVEHARSLDHVTDLYLCGHSQGGLIVMLIAGMYPGLFKGIIPISPAWMIPKYARAGEILGTKIDPLNIPDEFCQDETNLLSGNYVRTAQTIHPEDEMARYEGPVLIIHGELDETVPYEYGKKAADIYKNARLVTVYGGSHCFDNRLDKPAGAIKEFLIQTQNRACP